MPNPVPPAELFAGFDDRYGRSRRDRLGCVRIFGQRWTTSEVHLTMKQRKRQRRIDVSLRAEMEWDK